VALIDYTLVNLDPEDEMVWLHEKGMLLGLGGIAKGYALDRAGEVLREAGFSSFLLQAGGQVLMEGRRGDRHWRVGIRDPRGGPDDYFATLDAENVSVSTSGDYESYFILDGRRYHHILDPHTGWPAEGIRSVTIVAADATLADALSTAVFVLGPEVGMDVVEGLTGVEAVIVDAAGEVHTTEGVRERITVHHPPRDGL
jgi:thiamine biosynthesis lipoprotein